MKYIDPKTKEVKTIYTKASDTLPIGSIVDYDGEEIPDGWEPAFEDATVYIGPNEPTDGQDIWIQKGKNLLAFTGANNNNVRGIKTTIENNTITVKGTPTDTYADSATTVRCNIKPGTYTFSINKALNFGVRLRTYFEDGTYQNINLAVAQTSITFNIDRNIVSYYLYLYPFTTGSIEDTFSVQLEHGDKATEFEPYIEKKIYIKNEAGKYDLFVKNRVHVGPKQPEDGEEVWIQKGKNLFDRSKVVSGGIFVENGGIYVDNNLVTTDYIDVRNIKKLYWNKQAGSNGQNNWGAFYDVNKNFIKGSGYEHASCGQDVPEGAVYWRTNFKVADIEDVFICDYEYMISKIKTKNPFGGYDEFINEEECGSGRYPIAEERIGTYAGRPLYRRVVTVGKGQLPNKTYKNIEHGITNVDYFVNVVGFTFDNPIGDDTWFLPIPYASPTVGLITAVGNRKYIQIECSVDLSTKLANLIVDYTKTTD